MAFGRRQRMALDLGFDLCDERFPERRNLQPHYEVTGY